MNVFELIDTYATPKLLPFIRLVTIYVTDGVASLVCLVRYDGKKIAKKAKKIGLIDEKTIKELDPGVKVANVDPYDLQHGSFYLNYNTRTREMNVYKQ